MGNPTIVPSKRMERTLILLKPEAIQRGLIGKIIKRFEARGFKLVAMKFMRAKEETIKIHYVEHVNQDFYPRLIKHMTSGPVIPMVWEGLNVIKSSRRMLGPHDSVDFHPGTIRGEFSNDQGRCVIHGADSLDAAAKEIPLWFNEEEIISWTSVNDQFVYDVDNNDNDNKSDSNGIH